MHKEIRTQQFLEKYLLPYDSTKVLRRIFSKDSTFYSTNTSSVTFIAVLCIIPKKWKEVKCLKTRLKTGELIMQIWVYVHYGELLIYKKMLFHLNI